MRSFESVHGNTVWRNYEAKQILDSLILLKANIEQGIDIRLGEGRIDNYCIKDMAVIMSILIFKYL